MPQPKLSVGIAPACKNTTNCSQSQTVLVTASYLDHLEGLRQRDCKLQENSRTNITNNKANEHDLFWKLTVYFLSPGWLILNNHLHTFVHPHATPSPDTFFSGKSRVITALVSATENSSSKWFSTNAFGYGTALVCAHKAETWDKHSFKRMIAT